MALDGLIRRLDRGLDWLDRAFLVAANLCLLLMLVGTAATIVLRPFGISYYWIWPWTMQMFVWMSFIGFFVVYRRGKDIAVDFLVLRLGARAMTVSRYFVALLIMAVMGLILWQMPTVLTSQVGGIDGVITPWGDELQRYTLSIPLAVSCALILVNACLELLKAHAGWPESHGLQPLDS